MQDVLRISCVNFLQANEQLLRELAEKDAILARQQVTDLFAKIINIIFSKFAPP